MDPSLTCLDGDCEAVMTKHAFRSLDQMPLFADDTLIGAALLGPDRAREWAPIASLLESHGLPKLDELMGGRYVPAVLAFFDHMYGLDSGAPPLAPDGSEDFQGWKEKRKRQG